MPRSTVACMALFICSSILNEPALSAAGNKAAVKHDQAAGMVERVLRTEGDEPVDRRARLADILRDHPSGLRPYIESRLRAGRPGLSNLAPFGAAVAIAGTKTGMRFDNPNVETSRRSVFGQVRPRLR